MAKKKKRKGKVVVTGGVVGLLLLFLFNGNFSTDFFGDGEQLDTEPSQVEEQVTENVVSELIIEVVDNTIFVNEKEVTLDTLIEEVGEFKQIVFRAKDAKQITYDEVKSLLNTHDIVIIEE